MYKKKKKAKHENAEKCITYTHTRPSKNIYQIRAHLVHCNDYYMGMGISITRNTLSWNVISITIH